MSDKVFLQIKDMIDFANKLRKQGKINSLLSFPTDFKSVYDLITQNQNNDFLIKSCIEGTIPFLSYSFPWTSTIKYFRHYAFYGCQNLTSVYLTCERVQSNTFAECSNLLNVELQRCSCISDYAFLNCSKLNKFSINYSGSKSVYSYAFCNCTNLSMSVIPFIYIGEGAFQNCNSLLDVQVEAFQIKDSAFENCAFLSNVSASLCFDIGSNAFLNCSNLVSVTIPACKSIYDNAFTGCRFLSVLSLPACRYIGASAFAGINYLSLYLGTLFSVSIHSFAFQQFSGLIYVPQSRFNQYLSDETWVLYSNYLVSI